MIKTPCTVHTVPLEFDDPTQKLHFLSKSFFIWLPIWNKDICAEGFDKIFSTADLYENIFHIERLKMIFNFLKQCVSSEARTTLVPKQLWLVYRSFCTHYKSIQERTWSLKDLS